MTALLAAMTYLATYIFKIPTMFGYTNLGDCFVLLAAFLLGPYYGFLAGGIGSALADLLGGYGFYVPGTFIIKGAMALFAALLVRALRRHGDEKFWHRLVAALVAELWMVFGYWVFETLILGHGAAALVSIPSNLAQGAVGLVLALVLHAVLLKTPVVKKFAAG